MSSDNIIGFTILTELVPIVLRLEFSRLANERASNETSMHSREKSCTEYPSNTDHMERVHKYIVLCLEYEHEIESTTNTKRHTITETPLTERVHKEYSERC